jgi:post-GPI attachment to proteins factor 3
MLGFGLLYSTLEVSLEIFPYTLLMCSPLDLPSTERLDYFSAALAILYALYYTVIRLFHLYPHGMQARLTIPSDNRPKTSLAKKIWSLFCVMAYLVHISYLTLLPRFDYTYNMAFNVVLGLSHNVLWLIYSLPIPLRRYPSQPKSYRPPFAMNAAIFVVLTTCATALELLDFPPWAGIIDAHALWHLSTAPIALFWYDFLVEDALDYSWRDQRV